MTETQRQKLKQCSHSPRNDKDYRQPPEACGKPLTCRGPSLTHSVSCAEAATAPHGSQALHTLLSSQLDNIPSYGYITFCFPFIRQWTFKSFSSFGYCEQCCYERSGTGFSLNTCFQCFWVYAQEWSCWSANNSGLSHRGVDELARLGFPSHCTV